MPKRATRMRKKNNLRWQGSQSILTRVPNYPALLTRAGGDTFASAFIFTARYAGAMTDDARYFLFALIARHKGCLFCRTAGSDFLRIGVVPDRIGHHPRRRDVLGKRSEPPVQLSNVRVAKWAVKLLA